METENQPITTETTGHDNIPYGDAEVVPVLGTTNVYDHVTNTEIQGQEYVAQDMMQQQAAMKEMHGVQQADVVINESTNNVDMQIIENAKTVNEEENKYVDDVEQAQLVIDESQRVVESAIQLEGQILDQQGSEMVEENVQPHEQQQVSLPIIQDSNLVSDVPVEFYNSSPEHQIAEENNQIVQEHQLVEEPNINQVQPDEHQTVEELHIADSQNQIIQEPHIVEDYSIAEAPLIETHNQLVQEHHQAIKEHEVVQEHQQVVEEHQIISEQNQLVQDQQYSEEHQFSQDQQHVTNEGNHFDVAQEQHHQFIEENSQYIEQQEVEIIQESKVTLENANKPPNEVIQESSNQILEETQSMEIDIKEPQESSEKEKETEEQQETKAEEVVANAVTPPPAIPSPPIVAKPSPEEQRKTGQKVANQILEDFDEMDGEDDSAQQVNSSNPQGETVVQIPVPHEADGQIAEPEVANKVEEKLEETSPIVLQMEASHNEEIAEIHHEVPQEQISYTSVEHHPDLVQMENCIIEEDSTHQYIIPQSEVIHLPMEETQISENETGIELNLNSSNEEQHIIEEHLIDEQQVVEQQQEDVEVSHEEQEVILISDLASEQLAGITHEDGSEVTRVVIVEGENTIIFEPVYYGSNEGEVILNDNVQIEETEEHIQHIDEVEQRMMDMEQGIEDTERDSKKDIVKTPGRRGRPPSTVKKDKKNASGDEADLVIPCHMLGRNVENPQEDILYNGRVPPKPRLGVKVPYRNLTSQIISKQELTKEILERSKRNAQTDPPEGGDIFFAKELTKRLANKLAPLKKLVNADGQSSDAKPSIEEATTSKSESEPKANTPSSSSTSEKETTVASASVTATEQAVNDNADLIALLEGDGDVDVSTSSNAKSKPEIKSDPIKLPPSEELRKSIVQKLMPKAMVKTKEEREAEKLAKMEVMKRQEEEEKKRRERERQIALRQLRELPILPKVRKGTGLARLRRMEEEAAAAKAAAEAKEAEESKAAAALAAGLSAPQPQEPDLVVKNIVRTYGRKRRGGEDEESDEWDEEDEKMLVSAENGSPAKTNKAKRSPAVKVEDIQQPLISKRSRIIKRKVIWDPDAPPAPPQLIMRPPILVKAETESPTKLQKKITAAAATESKKKLIVAKEMPTKKQTPVKTQHQEQQVQTKVSPGGVGKKYKSEVDKLLMDEGAVNMLYAVKQQNNENATPETAKRRGHVSLTNKAIEVKNNLSATGTSPNKTLRKKATDQSPKGVASSPAAGGLPAAIRKRSQDSGRSSVHSPPPSPGYQYRQMADCSMIIRRHSSSSSFSSDNEGEDKPKEKAKEKATQNGNEASGAKAPKEETATPPPPPRQGPGRPRKRPPSLPTDANAAATPSSTEKKVLRKRQKLEGSEGDTSDRDSLNNNSSEATVKATRAETAAKAKGKLLTTDDKSKLSTEMAKNFKKGSGRPRKEIVEAPESNEASNATALPPSLQNSTFKEITINKLDQLINVSLNQTTATLNLRTLKELTETLQKLKTDDEVRAVLLTSASGTDSFCLGVDWNSLVVADKNGRKERATSTAKAMKEFLVAMAKFPKPLMAGVQGRAEGLGVMMLPLFDMVIASDTATFRTRYSQVGCAPEGAVLLTMGHLQQNALVSELLLTCKKLNASEAQRCGLVTRILWPDKFDEELIPIAKGIATQSAQSMEATKALLRLPLWEKLEESLQKEQTLLIKHWTSDEFQKNVNKLKKAND